MASEMIYPLLPLFLTQVLGAGAMSLGVIEGVGGSRQQRAENRLRLAGRSLARPRSSCSPATAVVARAAAHRVRHDLAAGARAFASPTASARGSARRRATRCSPTSRHADTRGRVFGFHRAMDHAGAVTGPLLASAYLYFYPGNYRTLFF